MSPEGRGRRWEAAGSSALRSTMLAVVIFVLTAAGCGGGDGMEQPQADEPATTAEQAEGSGDAAADDSATDDAADGDAAAGGAALARRPPGEEGLRVPAKRARIVVRESEFGDVLFDANGQVVYVFENDRPNRSNCTSEDCVEAWPPVLTRQEPSAGAGVDAGLLGTIRRDDGRLQVTYNGRPLYFYEHEEPGEIRCHNVDLHGGLWWVVTPQGEPAD